MLAGTSYKPRRANKVPRPSRKKSQSSYVSSKMTRITPHMFEM